MTMTDATDDAIDAGAPSKPALAHAAHVGGVGRIRRRRSEGDDSWWTATDGRREALWRSDGRRAVCELNSSEVAWLETVRCNEMTPSTVWQSWLLHFAAHTGRCPAAAAAAPTRGEENWQLHEDLRCGGGGGLYSSVCLMPGFHHSVAVLPLPFPYTVAVTAAVAVAYLFAVYGCNGTEFFLRNFYRTTEFYNGRT